MFHTLDEADVRGKRVLVRVDLNVPVENGKVADTTRIERAAPTIREIADKGGKVILLSHFGRPKGPDPRQSLKPFAPAIAAVLKRPVAFAEDCIGERAAAAINAMKPGDILCLENTRFHPGEERNDPAFVAQLAALGDRLEKVDTLIIGGGMANTFLAARVYSVGKSLCERDLLPTAREIMAKAKAKGREFVLPVDAVVAKTFAVNAPSRVVAVDGVGSDEMILDIGPRSIEHVCSVLARVKTLVWNGPFGAFELEPFDIGTVEVAEAAAELTAAGKIITVAGGGDTVAALNAAGATGRFTYVSTAGGAFLEWLEGKPLPGVEVLRVR